MEEIYTMHSLHGGEAAKPKAANTPPVISGMHMELAQAYVRPQPLDGVFTPEEGLRHGTAFPNLSMPYKGRIPCTPC